MTRCVMHNTDGDECDAEATRVVTYTDAASRPNEYDACDQHATQAVIVGADDGRDIIVTRRRRSVRV